VNWSRADRGAPGSTPGGTLGPRPVIEMRMPIRPIEHSAEQRALGGPHPAVVAAATVVPFALLLLASVAPSLAGSVASAGAASLVTAWRVG
jgi:hypothetical protein